MKKIFLFIICIIIVILAVFYVRYLYYKQNESEIKKYNLEYEEYLTKQSPDGIKGINGRELTTIINRAVDNNERNSVAKDEKGFYIGDETNSVQIDIQMIDIEQTYKMETIYNGGMTEFIRTL